MEADSKVSTSPSSCKREDFRPLHEGKLDGLVQGQSDVVGILCLRIDEAHAHFRGGRSGRDEVQVADFKSTLVRVEDDAGRPFLEEHVLDGDRLPAAGHAKGVNSS